MAMVAGIDEAGFGPILGPLVVSAATFSVPDRAAGRSLWSLLGGAVRKTPGRRSTGVAVNDSKRLYRRREANALRHLERGVLSMLGTAEGAPRSLTALLRVVSPDAEHSLRQYPWHAEAELPLPRSVPAGAVDLSANAVRFALRRAQMRLVSMRAEPVFPAEFNRAVQAVNNKATALLDVTSRLLVRLWDEAASPGPLHVHVDRQGGRRRYLPWLQRLLPRGRFRILAESETRCSYRVESTDRAAEIHFVAEGDRKHLPVALASMLSKYLRELFMELLNGYWARRVPGLAPTAGYYTDGKRFLRAVLPAARELGIDGRMLYRTR